MRQSLLLMAGRVEEMIARAGRAFSERDAELARKTIDLDGAVNRAEIEIDEMCMRILARRQPMASDLRFVTLVMKMVTDLERIGDLAVNICERVIALGGPPPPAMAQRLETMSQTGQSMIRDAIDGFIHADVQKARSVFARDAGVDEAYRAGALELQMQMTKEPGFIDRGIHLQAIAKFLERLADHATNLAELVIFQVEGKDVRHKAGRFDMK